MSKRALNGVMWLCQIISSSVDLSHLTPKIIPGGCGATRHGGIIYSILGVSGYKIGASQPTPDVIQLAKTSCCFQSSQP
jgi:hypothetical protein